MTSTVTHIAAIAAGIAIIASPLMISRNSLLKGLIPAVTLGIVAALLITAVRSLG